MTVLATGIYKKLTVKKQSALGTIAPGGAATGTNMRRVTSTLDLAKAFYKSAELRVSAQRTDGRHGVRSVAGTISGELSNGTYQQFFESTLRQAAQTLVTTGPLTNVTAALTATPVGTFTRAAGSYLTDGFNVGEIVTMSGWATTGVPNNAHNFMIITLTATVMTVLPLDSVPVGAKASGDSVTIVQAGKKTWIPSTGQTRDYYTIEHNFSDITQAEQFTDCVITGFNVKMGATGMIGVSFPVMGLNMVTSGAAYFTSPTGPSSGATMASANGAVVINGVKVGILTSLDLTLNGNYTVPGGVVGANVDPDIFPGAIDVTGTATILFADATYRDMFLNETIASLFAAFTADNTAAAAFTAFAMTKVKFNGANKDDGEKGLTLTLPFVALEDTTGGANELTTISVQDSAFT